MTDSASRTYGSCGGGQGRITPSPQYELLAANLLDRYSDPPLHSAHEVQEHTTSKWFAMLDLPKCVPSDEAAIEDWGDKIAGIAKHLKPSLSVLQRAMQASTDAGTAAVLEEMVPSSFEDLMDRLSLALFSGTDYPVDLEMTLLKPMRHRSVLEAKRWIQHTTARYLRVSARHEWVPAMSDSRMRRIILQSVPSLVEDQFWLLHDERLSLTEVFLCLGRIESALLRRHVELEDHRPVSAFPGADSDTSKMQDVHGEQNHPSQGRKKPSRIPPGPCHRCGEEGHGQFNDAPTVNVWGISLSPAERQSNVIHHATPGQYQTVTKKDRTEGEKLLTVADLIKLMRNEQRSARP